MTIFRRTALERLSSPEELDQLMQVTRPRAWLVLGALGALLVAALLWSIFATIPTTEAAGGVLTSGEGGAGDLRVVAYMPITASGNIQPGMAAKIAPNSFKRDQYGLLLGTVAAVDGWPSTQQEIAQAVGNEALAAALVAAGRIVRVVVAPTVDQSNPDLFRWTSETAPAMQLQPGMLCDVTITVSEQRLIDLVIP